MFSLSNMNQLEKDQYLAKWIELFHCRFFPNTSVPFNVTIIENFILANQMS